MTQEVMGPLLSSSEPISRRSLHDELVERLRELIGTGALAPARKFKRWSFASVLPFPAPRSGRH